MDRENILPYDGKAIYIPDFIEKDKIEDLFNQLNTEIAFKKDVVKIFGRIIETKRLTAFYSKDNISYKYSGIEKKGLAYTNSLNDIDKKIKEILNLDFNSCLANLYPKGEAAMSWHSDDEKEMDKSFPIASISLGAVRRFVFRHKKTKEKVNINLDDGSLLLMYPETQVHWQHALPISKKVTEPRINLTFRKILKAD
ncbi:MAG: alpha-ketoglutarate-dependent dioxygenase AlkB [Candidatus Kapaibacteriales bacterium]